MSNICHLLVCVCLFHLCKPERIQPRSSSLQSFCWPVKKVFEVVELMDMFDIYDSEEEALAAG